MLTYSYHGKIPNFFAIYPIVSISGGTQFVVFFSPVKLCTYLSLSYIIELNAHWSLDSTQLLLAKVHSEVLYWYLMSSFTLSLSHTHSVTKHTGTQRWIDGQTCTVTIRNWFLKKGSLLGWVCFTDRQKTIKYLVWSQVWLFWQAVTRFQRQMIVTVNSLVLKEKMIEEWVSNTILFDINCRELMKRVHYIIFLVRKS